jgi:hypothetical protein
LIPAWFQPTGAIVLGFAYALALLGRPAGERGRYVFECLAIAAAAWLGEESCILLYAFYSYSGDWWLFLSHVPVLIVAIWPMIVQSARSVVRELWPDARHPFLLVALVVLVDASLMESIAVANGLWSWVEPGYIGVPLIGVLGWVFFAAPAALALESKSLGRAVAGCFAAVLATHALILATWWGVLRWVLRGDLGAVAVLGFTPIALLMAVLVWRSHRALRPTTVLARVAAASIFLTLLVLRSAKDIPLVAHTSLVATPYLLASLRRPRGS